MRDLLGPEESGQGWGLGLSLSQLRSCNWPPASVPFFSSVSPPGIFHQLESKASVVTLVGEAALVPLAMDASGGA